jgi:hypothetical protein
VLAALSPSVDTEAGAAEALAACGPAGEYEPMVITNEMSLPRATTIFSFFSSASLRSES